MTMTREELDAILKAHKEWLDSEGKKGSQANLRNANLCDANLSGANLCDANLSGANLSNADLSNANLYEADLNCADLHHADLHHANLRNADLIGADLHFADLRNADLRNANLNCADLHNADLRNANLCEADLSLSGWPLWCGSLDVKIDAGQAAQLLYHTVSAMRSCADDADVAKVLASEDVVRLANRFRRVVDGECEPIITTESEVKK